MKIDELKKLLKKFDSNIVYSADLKKKNWFNIGGKAKVFFKAENLKDLVNFLKKLDNNSKSHFFTNTKHNFESSFFDYSNLEINLEKTTNDTYLKSEQLKTSIQNNQSRICSADIAFSKNCVAEALNTAAFSVVKKEHVPPLESCALINSFL